MRATTRMSPRCTRATALPLVGRNQTDAFRLGCSGPPTSLQRRKCGPQGGPGGSDGRILSTDPGASPVILALPVQRFRAEIRPFSAFSGLSPAIPENRHVVLPALLGPMMMVWVLKRTVPRRMPRKFSMERFEILIQKASLAWRKTTARIRQSFRLLNHPENSALPFAHAAKRQWERLPLSAPSHRVIRAIAGPSPSRCCARGRRSACSAAPPRRWCGGSGA